jgi:hypothetical protein
MDRFIRINTEESPFLRELPCATVCNCGRKYGKYTLIGQFIPPYIDNIDALLPYIRGGHLQYLPVDQVVVGSTPISHPYILPYPNGWGLFYDNYRGLDCGYVKETFLRIISDIEVKSIILNCL